MAYYEDALFIGDSITRQFHVYLKGLREEGFDLKTTLVSATSYTLYRASRRAVSNDRVELTYRGHKTPMFRIVEAEQPHTVFILLGVNDYIGTQIDKGIEYAGRIIDMVAEVAPDTRVVFISLTPVTRSFCKERDYRTLWDQYNVQLRALCEERGVGYLDLASRLKDQNGYLNREYSSDGQYHLNATGLGIWLDALMEFAQTEYEAGRWSPKEI